LGYTESLGGGQTINIMDLNLRAEDPWRMAAESLAGFIEACRGRALESAHFNTLVKAYQHTLRKWGVDENDPESWRADRMPTLAHLADSLAATPDPHAVALAEVLEQYAHGLYAHLFNQRTTVDIGSAPLVVFGLRSLREGAEPKLIAPVMWQVLRLVWNEIVAHGASRQPAHLIVDEASLVLAYPGAAGRLQEMARSSRKYLAALYLATQDMDSLLRNPDSATIANITSIKLFLKQENAEAARGLGSMFQLSRAEQEDLLQLGQGEGLLIFSNGLRLPLYAAVNPARLDRLSSNSSQQQAVALASGRRAQPVR
jgi:type IV secretory pathway VirB4 component